MAFVSGRQTEWLDYLPSPVLALKATTSYCAVGMEDGTVNVYSQNGRRYSISIWFSKILRPNAFRKVDANSDARFAMRCHGGQQACITRNHYEWPGVFLVNTFFSSSYSHNNEQQ